MLYHSEHWQNQGLGGRQIASLRCLRSGDVGTFCATRLSHSNAPLALENFVSLTAGQRSYARLYTGTVGDFITVGISGFLGRLPSLRSKQDTAEQKSC